MTWRFPTSKQITTMKATSISYKPWSLEIWALVGVLATFATLCAMLAAFDERAIFEWKSITLNTIVSTLSVIMKALLLFAMAECIGQWKWILFCGGQRALMDFERIDLASRGPLGSFHLAWRNNTPFILRLGTIVTVLTIAVDPFSQQLVQLNQTTRYVTSVNNMEATTLRAQNYDRGSVNQANITESKANRTGPMVYTMSTTIDTSMHGAILNGLSQPSVLIEQQMTVTCPSGNCTFDTFNTLGVCHRCTDATPHLEKVGRFSDALEYRLDSFGVGDDWSPYKDRVTAYVLPNGHFLGNLDGCPMRDQDELKECRYSDFGVNTYNTSDAFAVTLEMTAYSTGNVNTTITMQDLDTMIWSTSVIHIDQRRRDILTSQWVDSHPHEDPSEQEWNRWPNIPVVAEECTLYYCVKSVTSSVQGNILHEKSEKLPSAVRKPGSWEPVNEIDPEFYAAENIPTHDIGLDFDPMYAVIKMKDLVLHDPQAPTDAEYNLTSNAVWSISGAFQDELLGHWENETVALEAARKANPNKKVLYNGEKSYGRIYPPALAGFWDNPKDNMSDRFEAVAISMTNNMRITSNLDDGNIAINRFTLQNATEFGQKNAPIKGMVGVAEIRYRIEWYWIVLHAVVLISGVIFCGLTIIKSDTGVNVPAWKSHSLAILSQGPAVEKALSRAATTNDLEKIASKESIRMHLYQNLSLNRAARNTAAHQHSSSPVSEEDGTVTGRASLVSEDDRGRTDRTRIEEV